MKVKISAPDFNLCSEELKKFSRKYGKKTKVTIGIHAEENAREGGHGNAEIAAWNHFGTKTTPARPFLDVGILNRVDSLNKYVRFQLAKGEKPSDIMVGLGAIGVRAVQEQIDETYAPPNAPETIKRKGSSHPLIDTGEMRQKITFRVKEE